MIAFVDSILNRVTMYRVALYYLGALIAAAILFSALGWLPYDPGAILLSGAVATAVCVIGNWLFVRAFGAAASVESAWITAWIIVLIMPPAASVSSAITLGFVSAWAIASKYLIAWRAKHVFNPAAFAAALSALLIGLPATWWVGGNLVLAPVVILGGLMLVRKIRRFDLVAAFAVAALTATAVAAYGSASPSAAFSSIDATLLHSPFFFFAFVMLTEPATTPPERSLRILYGAFVGLLFAPGVHLGSFYLTPELALLAGNLLSYAVSPAGRHRLLLLRVEEVARDTYDFVFAPDRAFAFRPGQYLEWTLPHRGADSRGTRRYFTIASASREDEVRLGVKFYPRPSTFKTALAAMKPGETIAAANLAGDFTLPRDTAEKLVWIAGGIGATPFRSMAADLCARGERRDVVLLYAARSERDFAYTRLFDRAAALGVRTRYLPAEGDGAGTLDAARIAEEVPDWRERTFYLSGPQGMVETFKGSLRAMGVPRRRIRTDFFPGFA